MIEIKRTFDADKGLMEVENLSGVTFSAESFAHEFIIERTDNYGYEGTITARFIRGDGVTVYMDGTVRNMSTASVILPPECYAAPGPFLLVIFHVIPDGDGQAMAIYAGRGTVLASESGTVIAAEGTATSIEEQIQQIINRFSNTISTANLVAVFARNIGDIENEVAGTKATLEGIDLALAEQGIMPLSQPNMLKYQPESVSMKVASGPIVVSYYTIPAEDATAAASPITFTVTDANLTSGMVLHYVQSRVYAVCTMDMVTATVTNGSATVTIAARSGEHTDTCALDLVFCVQETAAVPYGEISYTYGPGPWLNSTRNQYKGVEQDEISERMVALGADAVTDSDGTVYSNAVAFTVTNAPEQGKYNNDLLVFNYGTDGGTRQDGSTYGPSGILDLVEGETYTMSCWARLTAGTKAMLYLGYGHNAGGYSSVGYAGNHEYIEITNTEWKRITWSFVYRATASYVPGGSSTPYTVEHKKRVAFGVCRYADGTVQLCGFRLVHGGLYASNTVETLAATITDLEARVAALEGANT